VKNLWAPWRVEYILGKRLPGCIFCPDYHDQSDEQRLILYRDSLIMVMMNKFPYNNGHLLVTPWRHLSDLAELTADEEKGLMDLIKKSTLALRNVMHPDGFNIGLNIGREAGAGYEEHLHFHIVPRWRGDTNFMAALADIRSIPEHILQTYSKLLPYFRKESADAVV
jgi:ATP adenylyltransferase